ncbi:curli assembly protein CsgF, partial [uncultured Salegentibacter sp.]|uniref:curli assembly protein CsgF n=1 Tax=uncultured Salegentibacter sp. TaxID=259320 RepID=UPI0030D9DFA0
MTEKKENDNGLLIIGWLILFSFFSASIKADTISFKFKSPSFSGIGTSAHYLTIDEQENSRREKIAEDIESALNEAARDADNTTLAKFLRNLESRIYSQLSRDLSESLFNSEAGGTGGSIVLEGNVITFVNTGTEIILTIIDEDGVTTEVIIPVGSF